MAVLLFSGKCRVRPTYACVYYSALGAKNGNAAEADIPLVVPSDCERERERVSEKKLPPLKRKKIFCLALHSRGAGGGHYKQPLTSTRASVIHHVVYSCRSLTRRSIFLRRDGGGGGGNLSVCVEQKVLNSENWIR